MIYSSIFLIQEEEISEANFLISEQDLFCRSTERYRYQNTYH